MMRQDNAPPELKKVFKKDFSDVGQIIGIELSPFALSQDLMLVAFIHKISLIRLNITENDIETEIVSDFLHPVRCICLGFSPETSISILPRSIIFATGGSDFQIRVFQSDLKEDHSCKVLRGHTSHINDVKFDPENNYLASVSDDNTARLWDTTNYKCVGVIPLTSPGVSVCWHRDDPSKLMVAEKDGLCRFYDVEEQDPVMSSENWKPLSSAHWCPADPQVVASLHVGELAVWDLARSLIVPVTSSLLFGKIGGHVGFSPSGEFIGAVNNGERFLKVVDVFNQRLRLSVPVKRATNISWHFRYPVICVGDCRKLFMYKINPI